MHTSERQVTTKAVALRAGLTPEQVEAVVAAYTALGYRLEKPLTHADMTLPVVRGIPSVLEGDR